MVRLFIGLALPERLRLPLSLLAGGLPGARWISAESLHLTLRFVGEVDHRAADDLADALEGIDAPAFPLSLAGLATFDQGRAPGTLYAAAVKAPALARLQQKVESVAVRVGLAPEPRKFTPHVTLARLKDAPAGRLAAWLGQHGGFMAGPAPIGAFQLFSSHLSRSGSTYVVEAEYPLAPCDADHAPSSC